MRAFRDDVVRAVEYHGHLCSGQCIGVKMAHMGMRILGLDNETDGKKIMVFVECNRCPADSIMMTTGCRTGRRTFLLKDYGKVAATFLNLGTGKAVRIRRTKHVYPENQEDMIVFYENLPESEFLEAQEVRISLDKGDYPGPPVCVVTCEKCGEEVMDNRHVDCEGKILCKACAKGNYYQEVKHD